MTPTQRYRHHNRATYIFYQWSEGVLVVVPSIQPGRKGFIIITATITGQKRDKQQQQQHLQKTTTITAV